MKLVVYFKIDPYESRQKALKLPSLEFRRKHGDMIQVLKVFNGFDRIEPDILVRIAEEHDARGHNDNMFIMQNRLEL